MKRRQLLQGILGAALAPAFVKASNLMPVRTQLGSLILWGDGMHDDTRSLQALLEGQMVGEARTGRILRAGALGIDLPRGRYLITDTIRPKVRFTMTDSVVKMDGPAETMLSIDAPIHGVVIRNTTFDRTHAVAELSMPAVSFALSPGARLYKVDGGTRWLPA